MPQERSLTASDSTMSSDLQSSNPFRRKGNAASGAPALAPNPTFPSHSNALPDGAFPNNLLAEGTPADTPDPEPPKRKKVVKRVRVQTPPPLSSDSESEGPIGAESPVGRGWGAQDPFEGAHGESPAETPTEPGPPRRNPFRKTLQDIEPSRKNDEAKASTQGQGKASLDVAAFSRLLLTGQAGSNDAGGSSDAAASTHTPPDPDTESDSSLLPSRHSAIDPSRNVTTNPALSEPPRSTRKPEPEAAPLLQSNERKKKPQPPSSRHGKAIRLQLGDDQGRHPAPPPLARTPSDFNKPLPPAPLRSPEEEDAESVFDREAAGRVPESSEPPSPAVSGYEVPGVAKRPTPVPPPRRNRSDGEERGGVTNPPVQAFEVQRRGSVESTHSRAESIRQPAPAPPPRRRPTHRSTSSITSPSSHSVFTPSTPHAAQDAGHPTSPPGSVPDTTNPKLAPPPPPARNPSTRRKASNNSIDGTRRVGRDREGAPPPPPRRQRGGSRGSLESLMTEGKRHGDGGTETLREQDEGGATVGIEGKVDDGQAGVILADLDALQREVDALQKQYASASRGQ